MEAQRGKRTTISSVIDERGRDIEGQEQIRKAFGRHFALFFGRSEKLELENSYGIFSPVNRDSRHEKRSPVKV